MIINLKHQQYNFQYKSQMFYMNTVWKLHWVGGFRGLYQIWYIFFKLNMILLIYHNSIVYIFVPSFNGQNTIFFHPKFTYFQVSCNSTVCNSQLKCIKFKDVFSKTTSTGILEERDFVNGCLLVSDCTQTHLLLDL